MAHQLAEAVHNHAAGSYEITLRPEELGRVRLALHPAESGVTVQISAERPETLELIRRHLPELDRDLRQLGHASVSFSFTGQGGERQQQRPPADMPPPDVPLPLPARTAAQAAVTAAAPPRRGLDIRL